MMPIRNLYLLVLFGSCCGNAAQAALTCTSITAAPATFAPISFGTGGMQTQNAELIETCNGNAGDTDLVVIGPGSHFSGTSRQLFSAVTGQYISYTVRQPDTSLWGGDPATGAANALGGPYIISRGLSTQLAYFSAAVPANTPSGIYTDSIIVNSPNNAKKTATLIVTLTLMDSCSISSPPTAINFGNAPAGASTSAIPSQSAQIGITCSSGLAYVWGADQGLYWSGSQRRLGNGGNFIAYELKENGTQLGDTGMAAYGGSNTTPGLDYRFGLIGNGSRQIYNITATLVPGVIPSAVGTYSDTVVYTVGW